MTDLLDFIAFEDSYNSGGYSSGRNGSGNGCIIVIIIIITLACLGSC